jgi:hypothetical protein
MRLQESIILHVCHMVLHVGNGHIVPVRQPAYMHVGNRHIMP